MRPLTKLLRGAVLTIWMLAIPTLIAPVARAGVPASGTGVSASVAAAGSDSVVAVAAPLAAATPEAGSDLGPTTAPPWNPPRPVSRQESWERVVRFPGRIVSLPLSAVGVASEHSLLFVENHNLIPRVAAAFRNAPTIGVAVIPASLGDRTGFGLGLHVAPRPVSKFMHVDLSASSAGYDRTRLELFQGPLALEYGYDWRPQDRFYGVGPQSREEDVSSLASQSEHVRATAHWPWDRKELARIKVRLAAWAGPRSAVVREGTHDSKAPSFDVRFPGLAGARDHRVANLDWGGEAAWDARGGSPHWSHGWRVLGRAERFDRPIESISFREAHPSGARFDRFEALVEGGGSFMRDPRTVRLTVQATHQDITANADRFLLSDLSALGGAAGLTGYSPGRFRDLDRLVGRLTCIFPLAAFYEFDLHAELGSVYPDIRHDAKLSTLKPSYGVALRPRTLQKPLGSLGFDWGPEVVRFRYSIGGAE
jgi:hypothetical protein